MWRRREAATALTRGGRCCPRKKKLAPRTQRSASRRRSLASPEVWFRIAHLYADHGNGCAEVRDQTVEVTLGPDWAFETGNLGSLTREVPAGQVVCAVPPSRRKPKFPAEAVDSVLKQRAAAEK